MVNININWALVVSLSSTTALWYYNKVYIETARHVQEANIFNNLYTEYSNPAMLDAFECIEEFRDQSGRDHYAYEYFHLKQKNSEEGKKLDHARRQIVRWYKKVKLFYTKEHLRWDRYGDVMPGKMLLYSL